MTLGAGQGRGPRTPRLSPAVSPPRKDAACVGVVPKERARHGFEADDRTGSGAKGETDLGEFGKLGASGKLGEVGGMETRAATRLEPLPCPLCHAPLEGVTGRHGVVWVCRLCEAGATTVGVVRQVAPREFVNHLWQAAQTHGVASPLRCPSCTQALISLGPEVAIEPAAQVCVRCFLVWLGQDSLAALPLSEGYPGTPVAVHHALAHAQGGERRDMAAFRHEAGAVLLLAAWAIGEVLGDV